jgi:glucose-6-phosphate 1-dehydrogenase
MDFHYSRLQDTCLPEACGRLLLDCMAGDFILYIRGDALEAAWKFVQPSLDFRKKILTRLYMVIRPVTGGREMPVT